MSTAPILKSEEALQQLASLAEDGGLDGNVLGELLAAAARHRGMLRRRGLFQRFDDLLGDAES